MKYLRWPNKANRPIIKIQHREDTISGKNRPPSFDPRHKRTSERWNPNPTRTIECYLYLRVTENPNPRRNVVMETITRRKNSQVDVWKAEPQKRNLAWRT